MDLDLDRYLPQDPQQSPWATDGSAEDGRRLHEMLKALVALPEFDVEGLVCALRTHNPSGARLEETCMWVKRNCSIPSGQLIYRTIQHAEDVAAAGMLVGRTDEGSAIVMIFNKDDQPQQQTWDSFVLQIEADVMRDRDA